MTDDRVEALVRRVCEDNGIYTEDGADESYEVDAVRAAVRAGIELAASECRRVYDEHRKAGSYPMDMGGLALECHERITALLNPSDR